MGRIRYLKNINKGKFNRIYRISNLYFYTLKIPYRNRYYELLTTNKKFNTKEFFDYNNITNNITPKMIYNEKHI